MMELVKTVEEVKDRSDLVVVIRELLEDLRNAPQGCENTTPPLYLDALAAWIEDMDGFFLRRSA